MRARERVRVVVTVVMQKKKAPGNCQLKSLGGGRWVGRVARGERLRG
jgi:hypothetical protein